MFKKETTEQYLIVFSYIKYEIFTYDTIARVHLEIPYLCLVLTKLRVERSLPTLTATHVTDLYKMLNEINASTISFFIKGGPKFIPNFIINAMFYDRPFKEVNFDLLLVLIDAARYSSFNSIEHLWSPISNRFSSVILSPVVEGESKAS